LIADAENAYLDTLEKLKVYYKKVNLDNAFIDRIRGRFNRYKYDKRKGVITSEQANAESNNILDTILELITEVKNEIA
jgi:hypothetical protein